LIYNSFEQPLFDIQHIIQLTDSKKTNAYDKYNKFKDKIMHYGFKKNQYGGYILKEFIPEEAMYGIILSSNSEFSKGFKSDVSKLLAELRKQTGLIIEGDQLKLNNSLPDSNTKELCDNNIKHELDLIIQDNETNRSYNNPYYCNMVKNLVRAGSSITIQKYQQQHVMYFAILTLNDRSGLNRIFCKIGYSADIVERFRSLRTEYRCGVFLVDLRTIKSEQSEKEFHKMIRRTKPHLSYPIKINSINKDEVYVFDEHLYREFKATKEYVELDDVKELDESVQSLIKDQYNFFIKYINEEIGRNRYNLCY
jgi:hypothetical protein